MRKYLAFFLWLAIACLIPGIGLSQDKTDTKAKDKDKTAKEDPTALDYQNLAKMKEVVGKIAAVDVKAKTMTLTIEFSHQEPNKNFNANSANQKILQLQQQIQHDYEQAARAKNPAGRQQALMRVQNHIQQLQNAGVNLEKMFTIVKTTKDFSLEVEDPLKVARATLPNKFDDQGEVVKYTDDQLKQMKSTDIQGAYTASPEDLKGGQTVRLYLDPPKTDKKTDTADGDSKDSKSSQSVPPANLSRVRMVLIQEEAPVTDSPDPKKKKKKDN
jgi:hypothetical protein